MAVARAWADHEMGREIGLVGLGPTDELDIEWSVAAPGQDLGFGAVRAVCAGRVVWAFASVLDPAELSDVMAELDGDPTTSSPAPPTASPPASSTTTCSTPPSSTSRRIRVVVRPRRATAVSTRVLDEVLRRMVAVVGAAELTKAA